MFREVRWDFPFHHVLSDAGTRKHQCPGLKWVESAVTSFGIVQTSFCIAFLCPFIVVERRNGDDLLIERFWSLPVSGIPECAS